jgi:hypothetical protein
MATLLELAKIKHHAVRSDGAKFLDGERDDTLGTSWLTVNNGQVTLGPGLYDELLVVNDEVIDDQIKAWANMGAPFYDAAGNIVYEGAGGRIEMDKDGQRFIRSADGQTMIEMDTETGSAYFKGDITGATGTFSGGISGGNGAFELTPSKLTINTPQFTLDGAGNAAFAGDITGASGTFSGDLSAKSVNYGNLNVAYAKVTSAKCLYDTYTTSLTQASSIDGWNVLRWDATFRWSSGKTEVWINHQAMAVLSSAAIVQISPDGSAWSEEIDLAYASTVTGVSGHNPYAFTVADRQFAIVPRLVTQSMVNFYMFRDLSADLYLSGTIHIRFKRHAIG